MAAKMKRESSARQNAYPVLEFADPDSGSLRILGSISLRDLRDGLSPLQIGVKWVFVDNLGKVVIDPQVHDAGVFHNGLAPIRIDDRWGFVEKSGKIAVPPRFEMVGLFSSGFAAVKED